MRNPITERRVSKNQGPATSLLGRARSSFDLIREGSTRLPRVCPIISGLKPADRTWNFGSRHMQPVK
jgi:hypothetical protein